MSVISAVRPRYRRFDQTLIVNAGKAAESQSGLMREEYLLYRNAVMTGYLSASRVSARLSTLAVLLMICRDAGLTWPRATAEAAFFLAARRFLSAITPFAFLAAFFAFLAALRFFIWLTANSPFGRLRSHQTANRILKMRAARSWLLGWLLLALAATRWRLRKPNLHRMQMRNRKFPVGLDHPERKLPICTSGFVNSPFAETKAPGGGGRRARISRMHFS